MGFEMFMWENGSVGVVSGPLMVGNGRENGWMMVSGKLARGVGFVLNMEWVVVGRLGFSRAGSGILGESFFGTHDFEWLPPGEFGP
jgi:hypothetical protein